MRKDFTVEQRTETCWLYTFTDTNAKGEKIIVELMKCTDDPNWKNSMPKLWKKNGYIDRVLETYWSIEVYCYDTENNCYGRYNPQCKLSEDGKRHVINFDWILEATEENKQKLIDEVFKLASAVIGETATEEKVRKVKEYAEERNIQVLTEMPEGWVNLGYCTAPVGSTWIGNMKPSIYNLRDASRKEALLLV